MEPDAWLLVSDSIDSFIQTIAALLDHNTGFKDFEEIPLEIAVGLQQYDKWADFTGTKLAIENSTIDFLKTKILDKYRQWYKETNLISIVSTFIIYTESVYSAMDLFDKTSLKLLKNEDSQTSFYIADVNKLKSRANLFTFLTRIDRTPNSDFRRVDEIFVSPNEYNSMLDTLEKNNVLFLIGDPEIGKTYCATRIMWEYYLKGYTPVWEHGGEPPERVKLRRKISDCEVRENKSITYMEDIFGKTKYENRDDLRRHIAIFIDKVKYRNSKVIISSREGLFREFTKEKSFRK